MYNIYGLPGYPKALRYLIQAEKLAPSMWQSMGVSTYQPGLFAKEDFCFSQRSSCFSQDTLVGFIIMNSYCSPQDIRQEVLEEKGTEVCSDWLAASISSKHHVISKSIAFTPYCVAVRLPQCIQAWAITEQLLMKCVWQLQTKRVDWPQVQCPATTENPDYMTHSQVLARMLLCCQWDHICQ